MRDLTRSYYTDICHIQHILHFLQNNIRMLFTVAGRIYQTGENVDEDTKNSAQFILACFFFFCLFVWTTSSSSFGDVTDANNNNNNNNKSS